jgi:hypothetical protein
LLFEEDDNDNDDDDDDDDNDDDDDIINATIEFPMSIANTIPN